MPAPRAFKFKAKGGGGKGAEEGDSKKRGRGGGDGIPSPKRGKGSGGNGSKSPSSADKQRKAEEASLAAVALAASVAAAAAEEERRNKLHYPKIDMDTDVVAKKLQLGAKQDKEDENKETSHFELLVRIVDEVVEVEKHGLDKFFAGQSEEKGRPSKGKGGGGRAPVPVPNSVAAALATVLDQLPAAVRGECPEDAAFQPEILPAEQSEIASLQGLLASMQEQQQYMNKYCTSIASMAQDYDLWLKGAPPAPTTATSSSSGSGNGSGSGGVGGVGGSSSSSSSSSGDGAGRGAEMGEEYDEALGEVQAACGRLLKGVEQLRADMESASESQSALYAAHNDTRLDGMAETRAPKKTKDLIKGYSRL
jgi:hypothetical protein